MTRAGEFTTFYAATAAGTLDVTYALSGDRQIAYEATLDAYRRAWRNWSKVRTHHPNGWVRTEAWRATALNRGQHPLRRRQEDDADIELLDALGNLSTEERRLIALLTVGDVDLAEASREVGVTEQQGIEKVTNGLDALERDLDVSIEVIEQRITALREVTRNLQLPHSDSLRRRATAGRRLNAAALIAAALALIVGGGVAVTEGGTLATRAELPYREKIGAERPDPVLETAEIGEDDLITTEQMGEFSPDLPWEIADTIEDGAEATPYSTCPTERFAVENPVHTFVRSFDTGRTDAPVAEAPPTAVRLVQSVEVAEQPAQAAPAAAEVLGWYAGCAHPRTRILSAAVVEQPEGDPLHVLRLRSEREPTRTLTVGVGRAGRITNTVVHEVDAASGPDLVGFARLLQRSTGRLCEFAGAACAPPRDIGPRDVSDAPLPPTPQDPQFLAVADMPLVRGVDQVWARVTSAEKTPSATPCDRADVTASSRRNAARIFVIPDADLPRQYGLAESIAAFANGRDAQSFENTLRQRIAGCEEDNLNASVGPSRTVRGNGFSARVWQMRFELSDDETVAYRTAIVRRGPVVAQLTFTPAGRYDIGSGGFAALVERAGLRLRYAGR